jgi:two-component system chemotaxis sensor kinase CheA
MSQELDRARDDFLSEAQDLIEALGKGVTRLDETAGADDPELLNEVFRSVHTLKGLSGLFGAGGLAALAHEVEALLDAVRLGRVPVERAAIDLLYESVDRFTQMLAAERAGASLPPATELAASLAALVQSGEGERSTEYVLDAELLGVLTEYEEHRLHKCLGDGMSLFHVHVELPLEHLEEELERVRAAARPYGELLTYLPSGSGAAPDMLELDVLMASHQSLTDLSRLLASTGARVSEARKRRSIPARPRTSVAPPPSRGATRERASASLAPPSSADGPLSGGSVATRSPPHRDTSLRSLTKTVRVDIAKLDALMNVVGELAIVRSTLGRLLDRAYEPRTDRALASDLRRLARDFERRLSAMQDGIIEVRMVPLGQVFDKLSRVVRQLGRDIDKTVHLVISGADTKLDKLLVEELSDPLMHIVRNAMDHGIERPLERERLGKPPAGTIALNAFQKGNHVVVEIEDDGRGIDTKALVDAALRTGAVTDEASRSLAPRELMQLVFVPGLSTRSGADEVSGRGVGMDVVKTNIAKLGGLVDLHSELGIGTKITVTLPITLAIISSLLLEVRGQLFALPLSSVEEAVPMRRLSVRAVDGAEVVTLRGRSLRVRDLGALFGFEAAPGPSPYLVVVGAGEARVGLVVDGLFGQQDVVIKPLGPSLGRTRGFAGAAELGDQRIALVLDTLSIVEEVLAGEARPRPEQRRPNGG